MSIQPSSSSKSERALRARRSAQRLAHIKAVASEAGVKLTHQRLEIFRELAASDAHPDADTVFRAVRERVPTVSLDTVYRTLWKLHDLGLVSTLGPNRDAVRFDANLDAHHHYVCVRCASVRDFECEELNDLQIPEQVRRLGTVAAAQLEVRGICADCAAASESPRKHR
jgi:Fur family peroxide stress response transcriptional regulator